MNNDLFAAEALRVEIRRMIKSYNRFVMDGNTKCTSIEEWLPFYNLVEEYNAEMVETLK